MRLLYGLKTFMDTYCIDGIFISVLLILFVRLLFPQKLDTHYATLILKWLILFFVLLIYINIISSVLFPVQAESAHSFNNRAFGPYYWAYWIMFFFGAVFPLLLFIKKLGNSLYFLFAVAVLMNIGWVFESFVSHVTSLHRGIYSSSLNPYLPFYGERVILLYGLLLGIVVLVMGNVVKAYSSINK